MHLTTIKCLIFNTDQSESDYGEVTDTELKPPSPDEIKDGQWLGVNVRAQKAGGAIIVCAHRYIQSPNLNKYHYGQGLCFILNPDFSINDRLQLCNGRPVEK